MLLTKSQDINIELVRTAWDEVTERNVLLKKYKIPKIEETLIKHHIVTHPDKVNSRDNVDGTYMDYINQNNNWENKMARPLQNDLAGIAEDGNE